MNPKEWALIAFTILTQMAVGAFLVLSLVRFFVKRKAGVEVADRMSNRIYVAIVVTLGLGMLCSLLHLSNPLGGPRAINNLATSWLSREILASVLFAVLAVVYVGLQWFKLGPASLRSAIAVVTILEGIGFIMVQARAYMLPAQPSWNTFATPITFYASTLLLGAMAVGAALVANSAFLQKKKSTDAEQQADFMRGAMRWIALASIVALGVEAVVMPVYLAHLSTGGPAALTSLGLMAGQYNLTLVIRLVLAVLGAGVLALFLYRNASLSGKSKIIATQAYLAFALVLTSEVLGRFVFYASHVRIGI